MAMSTLSRSSSDIRPKGSSKSSNFTQSQHSPSTTQSSHTHDLATLKVELKKWEHTFISTNKRSPKKADIQKLPHVRKMYRDYGTLKKLNDTSRQIQEKKKMLKKQATPKKETQKLTPMKDQRTVDTETQNVNLGPTPQIYGKVQSILDAFVSPSDRTPVSKIVHPGSERDTETQQIKRKLDFGAIEEDDEQLDFDADAGVELNLEPSSHIGILTEEEEEEEEEEHKFVELSNNVLGVTKDVQVKEQRVGSTTKLTSVPELKEEVKDEEEELEDFEAAVKAATKFASQKSTVRSIIASPIKLLQTLSYAQRGTPAAKIDQSADEAISGLGSPSPLIKLMGQWSPGKNKQRKSLYELSQERETILKEFKDSGIAIDLVGQLKKQNANGDETDEEDDGMDRTEDENEEGEFDSVAATNKQYRGLHNNAMNGKKSKGRRRKIKVLEKDHPSTEAKESKILKKNLHEELRKLKQRSVNEFYGIHTNDEHGDAGTESETDDEANEKTSAAAKKPRKKKYNLVSENFVRMKIQKKRRGNFGRFRR